MNYYGGEHLQFAWPGSTPRSLQQEMIDYARSALGRRLHAIGLQVPGVTTTEPLARVV